VNERTLITGGAGFIGSHLTDYLIKSGVQVTVLDDFSTGHTENLAQAQNTGLLRVVNGSVLSAEDVRSAMEGCGRVFHLAVKSVRHSIGRPAENHDVNAGGTLTVLEAARKAGIRRFVYCSSSEVYGNASRVMMQEDTTVCLPVTVYGGAKLAGEHYAAAYYQTYNLPTVVVRPFNAYGPRAHALGESGEVIPRFTARLLNGLQPVIFGNGAHSRDFTYVTDVAQGIALAGEKNTVGYVINVAYGRAVSILELSHAVAEACGRPDLKPIFHAPRPGDVRALLADVQRCRSVLGFRPEITLRDGLARYVSWVKQSTRDVSTLLEDQPLNWSQPA
jgi:UDP-glucose 4-epimerase